MVVPAACLLVGLALLSGPARGQGDSPVAPLPTDLVAKLAEQGITFTAAETPGKVSEEQAIQTALVELPLVGSHPATASLVVFTDENHGSEVKGETSLDLVERAAWAVVSEGVEVPLLGPQVEGRTVESYVATVIVFIDAETGEFLEAIALEWTRSKGAVGVAGDAAPNGPSGHIEVVHGLELRPIRRQQIPGSEGEPELHAVERVLEVTAGQLFDLAHAVAQRVAVHVQLGGGRFPAGVVLQESLEAPDQLAVLVAVVGVQRPE